MSVKRGLLFIFLLSFIFTSERIVQSAVPLVEIGKVENLYRRGKDTILSIKINTKLPTGTMVYISKEFPAVVGDMYNEEEGFYFYEATIYGKVEIKPGEIVYAIGEKKGTEVYLKLEKYREALSPKKQGQVISAYKERVQIDRGSLHEVRERDIYAVYGADGKLKAKIETSAIGDRESVGKIYSQKGIKIDPGDRVVHLGQRKFFGFGVHYGGSRWDFTDTEQGGRWKSVYKFITGGGLLYSWVFPGGWTMQWLWGTYFGFDNYEESYSDNKTSKYYNTQIFEMLVSFPFWVRKNFFYPSWFSPYLGFGIGIFTCSYKHDYSIVYESETQTGTFRIDERRVIWEKEKTPFPIVPFPVIGIELFSSRMLHFFLDAKYFYSPWVKARSNPAGYPDKKHTYQEWVFSAGFTTNW